jgi:hypothetical protein
VERRILSGFFKNHFLRLHRLAERKREAARKRTGIIFPTAISRTLLILRGRRLLFTVTSKKTGEEQADSRAGPSPVGDCHDNKTKNNLLDFPDFLQAFRGAGVKGHHWFGMIRQAE